MTQKTFRLRTVGTGVAAAALLVSAGAVAALGQNQGSGSPPANNAVPVTAQKITTGTLNEFAQGIGTVQAYRTVLVRARVDGTLETIAYREGQEVKPGDLLAEIDPRPYAAVLAQAEAKRAADQAQMENARRDLARYTALARTDFASRQQVDTQTATMHTDQANLQADDANIAAAALNLSFCRITAPIEGVVGLRLVDIGNLVHANDTNGIVTITQVHPIALVFTLPESELPAVRDAMDAALAREPDAPKGFDQRVPLKVVALTSDGGRVLSEGHLLTPNNSIDTTTGTITLKAEFANTDNRLWPGQFVAAKLLLATVPDAITLAPAAVQHGPDGLYVYVVKPDSTVEKRAITVGYEDDRAAQVTRGLSAGEMVVLSGQLRLQQGTKVDVRPASGVKS